MMDKPTVWWEEYNKTLTRKAIEYISTKFTGENNPNYKNGLSVGRYVKGTGVNADWKGYWFGKTFSVEHKQKISFAMRGEKHPNYGKHFTWSIEAREKASKSHLGERNCNWQGGIGDDGYPPEWTEVLREEIRKRDNNSCQLCGATSNPSGYELNVHHIDLGKNDCRSENLVTLCIPCHIKLHRKENDKIVNIRG